MRSAVAGAAAESPLPAFGRTRAPPVPAVPKATQPASELQLLPLPPPPSHRSLVGDAETVQLVLTSVQPSHHRRRSHVGQQKRELVPPSWRHRCYLLASVLLLVLCFVALLSASAQRSPAKYTRVGDRLPGVVAGNSSWSGGGHASVHKESVEPRLNIVAVVFGVVVLAVAACLVRKHQASCEHMLLCRSQRAVPSHSDTVRHAAECPDEWHQQLKHCDPESNSAAGATEKLTMVGEVFICDLMLTRSHLRFYTCMYGQSTAG